MVFKTLRFYKDLSESLLLDCVFFSTSVGFPNTIQQPGFPKVWLKKITLVGFPKVKVKAFGFPQPGDLVPATASAWPRHAQRPAMSRNVVARKEGIGRVEAWCSSPKMMLWLGHVWFMYVLYGDISATWYDSVWKCGVRSYLVSKEVTFLTAPYTWTFSDDNDECKN